MSNSTPFPYPTQTDIHLVPARERVYTNIREDVSGYAFVLFIIIAGQLGIFVQPVLGTVLTIISLSILLGVAAKYRRVRKVVLTAAIIPLLTLVNLTFAQSSVFGQTVVLYAGMLLVSLAYRYAYRKKISDKSRVKLHNNFSGYLIYAVSLGSLLGAISFRLLANGYDLGATPALWIVPVAILGAVAEESLFRGLIQRQAISVMKPVHAVILTSLLYVALTMVHFSFWSVVVGLISTIMLSTMYMKKSSVLLTTTMNAVSKVTYVMLIAKFVIG
jgi:membrane protease YdiL (CAAX protease family)